MLKRSYELYFPSATCRGGTFPDAVMSRIEGYVQQLI